MIYSSSSLENFIKALDYRNTGPKDINFPPFDSYDISEYLNKYDTIVDI
jgi:hypothetical protein